jgi:hypothetical protein
MVVGPEMSAVGSSSCAALAATCASRETGFVGVTPSHAASNANTVNVAILRVCIGHLFDEWWMPCTPSCRQGECRVGLNDLADTILMSVDLFGNVNTILVWCVYLLKIT